MDPRLLPQCAPHNSPDAAALRAAFREIAGPLANLRLVQWPLPGAGRFCRRTPLQVGRFR